MKWKRTTTVWLIVATMLVLGAWDVYVYLTPPEGDTISAVIVEWAARFTIVPFIVGALMGHFFWPVKILVSDLKASPSQGAVQPKSKSSLKTRMAPKQNQRGVKYK